MLQGGSRKCSLLAQEQQGQALASQPYQASAAKESSQCALELVPARQTSQEELHETQVGRAACQWAVLLELCVRHLPVKAVAAGCRPLNRGLGMPSALVPWGPALEGGAAC